jgi:osmotically inducible protein OsmC
MTAPTISLVPLQQPTSTNLDPTMKRTASAVWKGTLKQGNGTVSTPNGVLKNAPYSAASRFESGPGTNPEELIAAAHAGCFAMALSLMLEKAGFTADTLEATATVSLENLPEKGWTVTSSHLVLKGKVPGITKEKFQEVAGEAKAGCPISKLLNATITLEATLVS